MARNNRGNDFEIQAYEEGDLKLLFDLPTPRPHLIIKRKVERRGTNEIKEFVDARNKTEICNVLRLCINFLNQPENKAFLNHDVIFSLHTGFFCSSPEFHAHLCVNMDLYRSLFDQKAPPTITTKDFMPTKGWHVDVKKLSNTVNIKEIYIQNINSNYKSYVRDDLDAIDRSNFNPNASKDLKEITNANIILHSSLPKIGFEPKIGGDLVTKLYETLQIMKTYADQKGYFDKKIGGSHLCLYLNNVTEKDFNVTGYILATGDEYYHLFQTKKEADDWKTRYGKTRFEVRT